MKDIYDIVQDEIFSKLNNEVKIVSASALSGGTQTIVLCVQKWVRVGTYLKDVSNKNWLIQSITDNEIVVKKPTGATNLSVNQTLTLIEPKFLFGTRISADNEYKKTSNDNRNKLPLIWLVENIRETEYNYGSAIERDASLRFYFLDDNNPKQYLNEDYRKNVVTPMIGLKDEFLRIVRSNKIFQTYESVDIRTITRFGNETEQGVIENILSDNLSGLELSIKLSVKRKKECNC